MAWWQRLAYGAADEGAKLLQQRAAEKREIEADNRRLEAAKKLKDHDETVRRGARVHDDQNPTALEGLQQKSLAVGIEGQEVGTAGKRLANTGAERDLAYQQDLRQATGGAQGEAAWQMEKRQMERDSAATDKAYKGSLVEENKATAERTLKELDRKDADRQALGGANETFEDRAEGMARRRGGKDNLTPEDHMELMRLSQTLDKATGGQFSKQSWFNTYETIEARPALRLFIGGEEGEGGAPVGAAPAGRAPAGNGQVRRGAGGAPLPPMADSSGRSVPRTTGFTLAAGGAAAAAPTAPTAPRPTLADSAPVAGPPAAGAPTALALPDSLSPNAKTAVQALVQQGYVDTPTGRVTIASVDDAIKFLEAQGAELTGRSLAEQVPAPAAAPQATARTGAVNRMAAPPALAEQAPTAPAARPVAAPVDSAQAALVERQKRDASSQAQLANILGAPRAGGAAADTTALAEQAPADAATKAKVLSMFKPGRYTGDATGVGLYDFTVSADGSVTGADVGTVLSIGQFSQEMSGEAEEAIRKWKRRP